MLSRGACVRGEDSLLPVDHKQVSMSDAAGEHPLNVGWVADWGTAL